MDPCSGSVVITDSKTGKVKALVSYPGYDSNRLSNGTDSGYYRQLANSASTPLYNQALKHKTAPGSTFKPVSALAGLNEKAITTSTVINVQGYTIRSHHRRSVGNIQIAMDQELCQQRSKHLVIISFMK